MAIACATDFSDGALEAASVAASMARKLGKELILVHAAAPASGGEARRMMRRAAEGALSFEVERLLKLGVKVRSALLDEPLELSTEALLHEHGVNLIVTAAPENSTPWSGLGGTIQKLVSSARVPVLTVRNRLPFEEWLEGRRPLRVLLGVDSSIPFESARDWVRTLAGFGPLHLVAGHVFWPPAAYARLGLEKPLAPVEVTPQLQTLLEQEIAERVATIGCPVQVRVQRGMGRIADQLVALGEEVKADLLVVGTHQRKSIGSLWSVSRHALRLAPMSVACVPSGSLSPDAVELPHYERVVAAVDFSTWSDRAIAHACALVEEGGVVHLVHVPAEPLSAERRVELESEVLARVPSAAQNRGVYVVPEIARGPEIASALLESAERANADVICVGSHGRGGVTSTFLGSVSRQLLERSTRPVLVVRPPAA